MSGRIKLSTLKKIIKEELAAQAPAGGGLGKMLDDVVAQFASKMKSQFPGAEKAIQEEAAALKTQLTAQIKASAAKVKMSSQPS